MDLGDRSRRQGRLVQPVEQLARVGAEVLHELGQQLPRRTPPGPAAAAAPARRSSPAARGRRGPARIWPSLTKLGPSSSSASRRRTWGSLESSGAPLPVQHPAGALEQVRHPEPAHDVPHAVADQHGGDLVQTAQVPGPCSGLPAAPRSTVRQEPRCTMRKTERDRAWDSPPRRQRPEGRWPRQAGAPGVGYPAAMERITPIFDAHRARLTELFASATWWSWIRGELLDVGCGTGQLMAQLREAGVAVEGVEASERRLAACRERGLTVRQGDRRRAALRRRQLRLGHAAPRAAPPGGPGPRGA